MTKSIRSRPSLAITLRNFRLALIFADLTRHLDVWKQALEEWDLRESTVVNEWRAEGKAEGAIEGRRADVLCILELKFPGQVPAEWRAIVEAQSDLKELAGWLDALLFAASPAEFQVKSGIGQGK